MMELLSRVFSVLCSPRAVALYILLSFAPTAIAPVSLAALPSISTNCLFVRGAIACLSFLAVGGHFFLCLYFWPSLCSRRWPWAVAPRARRVSPSASGSVNAEYESLSSLGEDNERGLLEEEEEEEDEYDPAKAPASTPPLSLPFRLFLCAGMVLVLASVVAAWTLALLGQHLLATSLSPRAGTYSGLQALNASVHLEYTLDGISLVTAHSEEEEPCEHDLWYGQGWAHARARLWQMEFQRRVGRAA
jgi:hypothetical protein